MRTLMMTMLACVSMSSGVSALQLADTVARIKPSVVAVGTVQRTRRPPTLFRGTGFVVGDGRFVITNAHVLPATLDDAHKEQLSVFSGRGRDAKVHAVQVLGSDRVHDLAILKLRTGKLPALKVGELIAVREGVEYAFTGFPIGTVLGLYAVTHRGIISAISPIAIPQLTSNSLDPKVIRRLRDPYNVYQLDATAYPGNSGSPLYDPVTGQVIGVINKVFIKQTKEKVLSEPSGITYAIPARFVRELMNKHVSGQ
jgi:serine protease Do